MITTNAVDWHETIAQSFDEGYSRSPRFAERFEHWRTAIAAAVRPGDRVLDAGCGPGLFSFEAAGRGATVDAIDGSAAMIEICRRKQDDLGENAITFRTALLDDLRSWPAASYDVVMSSSVLEYLPDLETELRSLVRLLKPGGRILVSMPNASSVYRWGERVAFRLTGRPRYYAYVKRLATVDEMDGLLAGMGVTMDRAVYYAAPPGPAYLTGLLSDKRRNTLFLAVGTNTAT